MRIGITGGIGTGKTFIINYIRSKGYKIIDADLIAKQLMKKDNINYLNIVNNFGEDILSNNKEIDRIKLRHIIFEDEKKRKLLNKITHPNIIREILNRSKDNDIYFIEIPLLLEENLEKYFDLIWVVDCSKEVQVKRVVERNNLSEEEVFDIIRCQMPREEKIKRANIVINSEQDKIEKYIDDLLYRLEKQVKNEK